MKKPLFMFLILFACLLLSACGKTEAVLQVETMIDAFETVTADSLDDLSAVSAAYEALSEEEKKTVKNHDRLTDMINSCDEQRLTGTWYPCLLNPWMPQSAADPLNYLVLNEDMTAEYHSELFPVSYGAWSVENGEAVVTGIYHVNIPTGSYSYARPEFRLSIDRSGEDETLVLDDTHLFAREAGYTALMADILLEVDCAEDPLNDYFSFHAFRHAVYDEWGVPTGSEFMRVCLKNDLFDDGWYFIGTSEDFALEYLYPAHTMTMTGTDGDVSVREREGGSHTVFSQPFNVWSSQIDLSWSSTDTVAVSDLTTDDITIGRAKGSMYFINSRYVSDVINDDDWRKLVIDHTSPDGIHLIGEDAIPVAPWEEANQDY